MKKKQTQNQLFLNYPVYQQANFEVLNLCESFDEYGNTPYQTKAVLNMTKIKKKHYIESVI